MNSLAPPQEDETKKVDEKATDKPVIMAGYFARSVSEISGTLISENFFLKKQGQLHSKPFFIEILWIKTNTLPQNIYKPSLDI